MPTNRSEATGTQRIDIVGNGHDLGSKWQPVVREETTELLAHQSLDDDTRDITQREAVAVLAQCVPPDAPSSQEVGIVIGHIQSGKTLSFTTLTALARDNGYRLVIVITGISTPLLNQSTARLRRDLRLEGRNDHAWHHFDCPRDDGDRRAIRDTLDSWGDPVAVEHGVPTVLITVMKNHVRLARLAEVLRQLDLTDVPTLVVDDEADQAGLNIRGRQGEQSTTYRRLLEVRAALPHHTLLQYTATPQAPLLITLIDALSPRFAEILTPGPDYVGGAGFFHEHDSLVRAIPAADLPDPESPLTGPPDTLLDAIRLFFLGVAAGWVNDARLGHRSMLIHPSRETVLHREFCDVVTHVMDDWKEILALPADDGDRGDLVADFREAYDDIAQTTDDLPCFGKLLRCLGAAIRGTRVWEMNATTGETPPIDWSSAYSHILVGGQALDRGFTVEGLTVTYMPRGVGVGNADTVHQRARFLGYKRQYLGYCRVYLEPAARNAYADYVEHEQTLRKQLVEHKATGQPLSEWRRAFFLTPRLRPTRAEVLELGYVRGMLSNQWFDPGMPHYSPDAPSANREVIHQFVAGLNLQPDAGRDERTAAQRHVVDPTVSLQHAFDELLARVRFPAPHDSRRMTGLLLQIRKYLDDRGDTECAVYQMGTPEGRDTRRRGLKASGEIRELFQGANPSHGPRQGEIYPGDREIH